MLLEVSREGSYLGHVVPSVGHRMLLTLPKTTCTTRAQLDRPPSKRAPGTSRTWRLAESPMHGVVPGIEGVPVSPASYQCACGKGCRPSMARRSARASQTAPIRMPVEGALRVTHAVACRGLQSAPGKPADIGSLPLRHIWEARYSRRIGAYSRVRCAMSSSCCSLGRVRRV